MKEKIAHALKDVLTRLMESGALSSIELSTIQVMRPTEESFGDYTTNIALMLAKEAKMNPRALAEIIRKELESQISNSNLDSEEQNFIQKIEVAGAGYLNFYCSNQYFQEAIVTIAEGKIPPHSGVSFQREKVMVEYSQPNTHKEFHIGHLRNVFIGSTIVNVLRASGHEVMAVNYIGDTGTHVAKCLWGLVKFHDEKDLDAIVDKAEFLGRVYSDATKKIDEHPQYEDEFKALQKSFEAGDPKLVALWEKTKQWSLDGFMSIYRDLGIAFDVFFYESEEEKAGRILLPELLEKGIVEKSEGAIIANLEKYNLGVLVLVRKDGSALYGLKDIPLAKEKFEKYGVEKSIIVVDVRQSLYFQQLFKILELYGFHKKMAHYGYEFVALKGGESMASRKGNVITARLLIETVVSKVEEKFPDAPHVEEIGIGAIRFAMLKHSAKSKIEFDIEESIKLEGATGPYVQYAHARMASILRKAEERELKPEENITLEVAEFHPKEKEVIRELIIFPELLQEVAETYEVHKLSHYALHLAEKFHSFYAECQVIDDVNPQQTKSRLMLVQATKRVLGETLRLMGISAPEKM